MEVADTNPIGEKNKQSVGIAHIADGKQGKNLLDVMTKCAHFFIRTVARKWNALSD